MTLLSTGFATQTHDDATLPRSWALPSRKAASTYLFYAAMVGVLFVIGYGGANWLASQQSMHLQIYRNPELAIPLVPEMIWAYLSINLLFVLPLFSLDISELRLLGRRMIAATLIAVGVFVVMPTTIGFARLDLSREANLAFELLYALDHPYNCVPSLHVAYSALIILAVAQRSHLWVKALFACWLVLVMASTVLTHQHHLIDIAAALAMVGGLQYLRPKPETTS